MSVDELCDTMSGLIPVHDGYEEMDALKYSGTVPLELLVNLEYLNTCYSRYNRYLKYINFERYYCFNGYTIVTLIHKFLESDGNDLHFLANLSLKIDKEILRLFYWINEDDEEDQEEYFEV